MGRITGASKDHVAEETPRPAEGAEASKPAPRNLRVSPAKDSALKELDARLLDIDIVMRDMVRSVANGNIDGPQV